VPAIAGKRVNGKRAGFPFVALKDSRVRLFLSDNARRIMQEPLPFRGQFFLLQFNLNNFK
jgi:hypothetical protein